MGTIVYRVTGIGLAITIVFLGTGVSVALYYAGQAGIDVFYTHSTYKDEHNRINRRLPTDDWYGELLLRGWALGFLYIIPGLSGFTASLFFNKCLMGVHVAIAIFVVFVGSFLHTAGGLALLLYRLMIVGGAARYSPWLGDCIYVRDDALLLYEYVDEKCLAGRQALMLAIVANCTMLISWIFVLADLLYIGFTFHIIGKAKKKVYKDQPHRSRPRRPRNQRNIPHTSAELDTLPKAELTNAESGTTEGTAVEHTANVAPPEIQDVDTPRGTVDSAQTIEMAAIEGSAVIEDTTSVAPDSPGTQDVNRTNGTVDNDQVKESEKL